jgi:16S rRNA (guanine(966)-N(2))-methyltransferase RsmD
VGTRIGSGGMRGKPLRTAAGGGTRPLLARIKQSLFGILGPRLPGARVLDVFAGTGGFALEALSRGAAHAVLIESGPDAARAIGDNIRTLGAGDRADVRRVDAEPALAQLALEHRAFEMILLDPPFALERDEALLALAARVVADGGIVVLRVPRGRRLPGRHGGLRMTRQERYGESLVGFYSKES